MFALLMGASFAVAAPVPIDDRAEKALRAKVDAARPIMVKFLKDSIGKDGTWEDGARDHAPGFKGGTTALVVLALLDAGVPANDAVFEKALPFLAKLEADKTYCVSLATQALARADAKKYAEKIQANADWLMKKALVNGDKLRGWSYPLDGVSVGDGSNAHFAIAALHAAQTAGAKVDKKLWGKVRDLYVREQTREGGWSYVNGSDIGRLPATASMTVCGTLALALADKHDKPAKPTPEFAKGMAALLSAKELGGKNEACALFTQAELGRALGTAEFKHEKQSRAWYREGAERVFKAQAEDGSVKFEKGLGTGPVTDTAFALYALGPPVR
jgi:hypothetical protein